ncbi:MAG: hypothetical protein ACK4N5_26050 [Myxococcales bacterium]
MNAPDQTPTTASLPPDFDMETSPTLPCAPAIPLEEPAQVEAKSTGSSSFHRLLRLLGLATSLALFTGCYTVKVNAPKNALVVVADDAPGVGLTKSKRNWYLGRGLIPLNDNSAAEIIEEDCAKVGLSTEMSAVDAMIEFGIWAGVATTGVIVATAAPPLGALIFAGSFLSPIVLPTSRTTNATCYERRTAIKTPPPVYAPPPGYAPQPAPGAPAQPVTPAHYVPQPPPGYVPAPPPYSNWQPAPYAPQQ